MLELPEARLVPTVNWLDSMNQAFSNGNFYGLEYVLDELAIARREPTLDVTVDWYGATDYFA